MIASFPLPILSMGGNQGGVSRIHAWQPGWCQPHPRVAGQASHPCPIPKGDVVAALAATWPGQWQLHPGGIPHICALMIGARAVIPGS